MIVLAFLFRSLVAHLLTKDVEKFKVQLKADADQSIEQFKSTLSMTGVEHQVRFSKLHEKCAQVIADLYEKFVVAYWAAHTYHQWWEPAGGPTQEQQANAAMQSLHEAFRLFEVTRIYMSEALSQELDAFFEKAKTLNLKVSYYDFLPERNKTKQTMLMGHAARTESLEAFQKEFLP